VILRPSIVQAQQTAAHSQCQQPSAQSETTGFTRDPRVQRIISISDRESGLPPGVLVLLHRSATLTPAKLFPRQKPKH
jgi:hypothetical protein